MRIKKKKGRKLLPIKNKYGLDLGDFYNLQSGKIVTVDSVPKQLKGMVDEIKEKK